MLPEGLFVLVFDQLAGVFVDHVPEDSLDLPPGHAYWLLTRMQAEAAAQCFAELDEAGWQRMAEDARELHRADLH